MSGVHHLLLDIASKKKFHSTAEFPTEAARDAQRYTQSDVGKVVRVLSPSKWWLIVSVNSGIATFHELAPDVLDISLLTSEISNDSTVSGVTAKDALDTLSSAIAAPTVASAITNDSSVAGATVKAALDELASHAGGGGAVSSVFGRTGVIAAQSGDYNAAQVGAPPTTRAIAAGIGLTGGGDLSTDRTLGADFGAGAGKVCEGNDARLSDARQPTSHAASHLPSGEDALLSGPPSAIVVGGGNAQGSAEAFARQDHVHALPAFGATAGHFCEGNDPRLSDTRTPTSHAASHLPGGDDALVSGPPSAISVGGANLEGTAMAFARQDHAHALPSFGSTAGHFCEGDDARLSDARTPTTHAASHLPGGSDALVSGPPSTILIGGANDEGSASAFARQDHVHALPGFGASDGTFCEGSDARLSDARSPTSHAASHLPGGPDALVSGPPSAIIVGGANDQGSASAFARQDHVHALPAFGATAGTFCEGSDARLSNARPPTSHAHNHLPSGPDALMSGPPAAIVVGGGNVEGTADAFARQDHVHALPAFGATAGAICEGSDARLSNARTPLSHALSHLPDAADGLATAAPNAVGTANSAGTANSFSRSDHTHDASALLPRDGSRALTAALNAGGNNLVNIGAVFEAPTSFAWVGNAATIDVSVKNDFVSSAVMSGNSTITLANGVDGCQGTLYVKQDATGNRTLSFVVAGRTILREAGAADSNPQPAAQKVTGYCYDFKTIGGTPYAIIERFYLS